MATESKLKRNSYALWKVEDDYKLWTLRDQPVSMLANKFERTNRGITCRLEKLRDPNHKAHLTLFAKYNISPVPRYVYFLIW